MTKFRKSFTKILMGILISSSALLVKCKGKSEDSSSSNSQRLDSTKSQGASSTGLDNGTEIDSSFVMSQTWLKLERDEEGQFYLPLEPCDKTDNSFTTPKYYVNGSDSTFIEQEVGIASRYKIEYVKCSGKGYLNFKVKFKTNGPDTVIVEQIDELHPERKICRFLQMMNASHQVDTLGLFIAESFSDKVNHKRLEECN